MNHCHKIPVTCLKCYCHPRCDRLFEIVVRVYMCIFVFFQFICFCFMRIVLFWKCFCFVAHIGFLSLYILSSVMLLLFPDIINFKLKIPGENLFILSNFSQMLGNKCCAIVFLTFFLLEKFFQHLIAENLHMKYISLFVNSS